MRAASSVEFQARGANAEAFMACEAGAAAGAALPQPGRGRLAGTVWPYLALASRGASWRYMSHMKRVRPSLSTRAVM